MRPRVQTLLVCAVLVAACTGPDPSPSAQDADRTGDVAADAEPSPSPAPPPQVPTMAEGTLTACVAPTPAVAEPVDGDWEGFDVAVLDGVADQLVLDLAVVPSSFDEIVSGVALNSGRCDVAAGAVMDADALSAVARTSAPYRTVHRLVVTTAPTSEVAPDRVTGRVGVEDGGMAADAVDALTAAEVIGYPSHADLARALAEGAVDAALVSARARNELEAETGTELSVRAAVPTGQQTVLLLPLTADDDLVEAVDGSLAALREAGELDAWRDDWLGG